jgi:transposase
VTGRRFVPVESEVPQALSMRRRARGQLIGQRPATINVMRGHPADLGIMAAQRHARLRQLWPLSAGSRTTHR